MHCLIGISLTLIAIVAGMLLLAKTQKDNLGNIYKAVSYFVIIVSFLGFLCGVGCGICSLAHCGKGAGCMMNGGGMGCGSGMMMGGGCKGEMRCNMGMMGEGMGCGKGKMKCSKKKKVKMMQEDFDDEMEDVNVEIIQKKMEKEKPEEKK